MATVVDSFGPSIAARVRGMKADVLSRVEIEGFLEKRSLQSMQDQLLNSPYENELAESLTRYAGADAIEDAVSRNLVNTFGSLRRLAEGHYEDLVEIFVARWDLKAVKALLRIRHHNVDVKQEAGALVPGPSLPVALMEDFASHDSMETLVGALSAWNPKLCSALVEKLPEYQENKDLRVLEEALDRNYFTKAIRLLTGRRDEDSKFLKSLLRMEVDRINLRLLFSPRPPGAQAEDVIPHRLPRGNLDDKLLRDIAASTSVDRSVALLEGTPYSDLAEGLAYLAETGRFSRLERSFESAFMEKLRRAALRHPIGIAILMRYAWLKYNEVMNLRLIARGLGANLPREVVEEELLYV